MDQNPDTHTVLDTKGHWSRRRHQTLLRGDWATVDQAIVQVIRLFGVILLHQMISAEFLPMPVYL